MVKITKDKFDAYFTVQQSGVTNMFGINNVIFAAEQICDVKLTKEECIYIMHNYSDLHKKYMGGK